jgi:hypothetical protein
MPQKLFLLREVASQIGVRPHQIDYAILSNYIPEPSMRLGNVRVWTSSEVKAAQEYFSKRSKTKKGET